MKDANLVSLLEDGQRGLRRKWTGKTTGNRGKRKGNEKQKDSDWGLLKEDMLPDYQAYTQPPHY